MDLRYMGFDQHDNTRAYKFDGGPPTTTLQTPQPRTKFLAPETAPEVRSAAVNYTVGRFLWVPG